MTLFPGPVGVVGPPIALAGTLSMLLGVYLADRLLKRKASQDKNLAAKTAAYFTALGAFSRTTIVPFVMYPVYRFVYPTVLGLSFSDAQIMAIMPALMLFAATLSLYTIPIGYLIAKTVSRNLKVGNRL
jgi:hypothetical protein